MPPVGPDDHVRGAGPVAIFYGDYECTYCAREYARLVAEPVTLVFRHFPVVSKHPRSEMLARAAEAAARQDRFWDFHEALFTDQGHLDPPHLWQRCERLGLDVQRFEADRRAPAVADRVRRDFRSGVRAGVTTTPAVFRSPPTRPRAARSRC